MDQILGVAAVLVALGGLLTILVVLGWPVVHRQVVVLRLRRSLHRIDDVLAGWQREARGWHTPTDGI